MCVRFAHYCILDILHTFPYSLQFCIFKFLTKIHIVFITRDGIQKLAVVLKILHSKTQFIVKHNWIIIIHGNVNHSKTQLDNCNS